MKVCYLVVKKNQMLEIDKKKITKTIFMASLLFSEPSAIATMATMSPMPNVDIKGLIQAVIQVRYPQSVYFTKSRKNHELLTFSK